VRKAVDAPSKVGRNQVKVFGHFRRGSTEAEVFIEKKCRPECETQHLGKSCLSGCGKWKGSLPKQNKITDCNEHAIAGDQRSKFKRT